MAKIIFIKRDKFKRELDITLSHLPLLDFNHYDKSATIDAESLTEQK